MHIDAYTFGRITINGEEYNKDLIVFPDRISPGWWRNEAHVLTIRDLDEIIEFAPEYLIVGTGFSGILHVPDKVKAAIGKKGIDATIDRTANAVDQFNRDVSRGKRVAGAFHLTC